MVFRMARRLAAELAEAADIVERDRRLPELLVIGVHRLRAGQVQHGPQQHRGVAVREHEAVAVGPDRILRVEAHDPVPDRVDQRRQRHRRAGVPGLGLLDRVDREGADGVDRELVEIRAGQRAGFAHGFASTPALDLASSAAAWSATICAVSRRTRPAGIEASPSRRRASIRALPEPVTSQRMRRARLRIG